MNTQETQEAVDLLVEKGVVEKKLINGKWRYRRHPNPSPAAREYIRQLDEAADASRV